MISFLLRASSFVLFIWASIFARSHKDPQDLRNRKFPKSITMKTKYNSDKIWQIIIWIQDAKPESIKAVDFSGAVLGSGSMWVLWHMTSNSDLFFITSSFILLAFSLLSLSTSADNYWRKKHIIKNPLLLNMKRKKKNNQVRMLSNLFNTLCWKNTRFQNFKFWESTYRSNPWEFTLLFFCRVHQIPKFR